LYCDDYTFVSAQPAPEKETVELTSANLEGTMGSTSAGTMATRV